MTTDRDFLLLALDGLTARLNTLEAQVEAIRQAANGLDGHKPKMGKPRKAAPAEAEEPEPISKQKAIWTPERRAAKAALTRKLWKKGIFGPMKNRKAAKTPAVKLEKGGKKWSVAQRKRFSETMKAVYAKKKGGNLPQ